MGVMYLQSPLKLPLLNKFFFSKIYLAPWVFFFFFAFFCFALVISLFEMIPNQSTEVLTHVPKYKKAGMHLMEKVWVLDKLHLGMC